MPLPMHTNALATIAALLAMGATDEEAVAALNHIAHRPLPADPAETLADLRAALAAVR